MDERKEGGGESEHDIFSPRQKAKGSESENQLSQEQLDVILATNLATSRALEEAREKAEQEAADELVELMKPENVAARRARDAAQLEQLRRDAAA